MTPEPADTDSYGTPTELLQNSYTTFQEHRSAPGLRLAGSVRFGGVPLLENVTLDLVPGGWTCLLGPSGSGKSTLLRLIAGLDTGSDFDGTIIPRDGNDLVGRVAYMAQDDLLLPWLDLRGNVALGARLRDQRVDWPRVDALIDRLGLSAHATKRPAKLSGGQRQRAALARTLMENKHFVLLTVLLVTHDPMEAARLGHALYLMEGRHLHALPPPDGPAPIRPVDDPETLAYSARLLARLRSPA